MQEYEQLYIIILISSNETERTKKNELKQFRKTA